MLLQRLNEYADRLGNILPAEYYRPKQIHWVLDLKEDGTGKLTDLRVSAKNRDQARIVPVPYVQRSGTKVPPYLLVDTAEFVLGVPKADKKTRPPTRHRRRPPADTPPTANSPCSGPRERRTAWARPP